MRVLCNACGGKARITGRENISTTISHLYCQCLDAQKCGTTFVMALSFSHTINPPCSQHKQFMLDFFRSLPEQERHDLLQQTRAAA